MKTRRQTGTTRCRQAYTHLCKIDEIASTVVLAEGEIRENCLEGVADKFKEVYDGLAVTESALGDPLRRGLALGAD